MREATLAEPRAAPRDRSTGWWQDVRVKKPRDEQHVEEHQVDAVARIQYYMASRSGSAEADEQPAVALEANRFDDGDAVFEVVPEALEAAASEVDLVTSEQDAATSEEPAPEEPLAAPPVVPPEATPEAREADPTVVGTHRDGVRARLDKAPSEVAAMFDRVAKRYDLVNDLLAVGQTRIWRGMTLRAVAPGSGERILDLAAGTGTSSAPFAAAGAEVIPCDFSIGMLEVGKRRQPELSFVAGDALNLPFKDGVFDAVTISFGLRNVQDTGRALREMLRVTKPGGRMVICEFSSPTSRFLRKVYSEYLMKALPAIARRTSSNPAAYVYLAESITAWPDQRALADLIADAGWERPQWRNATGGIVAIHRAHKAG